MRIQILILGFKGLIEISRMLAGIKIGCMSGKNLVVCTSEEQAVTFAPFSFLLSPL